MKNVYRLIWHLACYKSLARPQRSHLPLWLEIRDVAAAAAVTASELGCGNKMDALPIAAATAAASELGHGLKFVERGQGFDY